MSSPTPQVGYPTPNNEYAVTTHNDPVFRIVFSYKIENFLSNCLMFLHFRVEFFLGELYLFEVLFQSLQKAIAFRLICVVDYLFKVILAFDFISVSFLKVLYNVKFNSFFHYFFVTISNHICFISITKLGR